MLGLSFLTCTRLPSKYSLDEGLKQIDHDKRDQSGNNRKERECHEAFCIFPNQIDSIYHRNPFVVVSLYERISLREYKRAETATGSPRPISEVECRKDPRRILLLFLFS